ncbi:MAG: xanthine dehydrogenase accessory protein XdhC [Burkholderiales bacterium]|nr:xanthine dehydrogenase accessory protein XdhC [Burkholderiales bacterium]
MHDCISFLREAAQRNETAIVVTVSATRGSVPRDTGTNMFVTASNVLGTIGGGHLEFKAIDIARNMILSSGARAMHRFVLGATLGQCCGGVMNLTFEAVADDAAWLESLTVHAPEFHLVLFGAGHVGRAVVRVMSELSCAITWVDSREDEFPKDVPANVQCVCTDEPVCEVDVAGAGSYFLVMTHSHALDQTLSERILKRDDFAYFGLIGSVTKRRQFERRLRDRGVSAAQLASMHCPIGVAGIAGKEPATIAIAVAAEILQRQSEIACARQSVEHGRARAKS